MTLFTGTIPTVASGDTTTVPTNLAIYRDALKAASEAWTAYTPTWSGTLGNGTLIGKWARINKTVHYRVQLTWGSTSSHAAANQTFALPTAAHADYTANMHLGNGLLLDVSAVLYSACTAGWLSSTSVFLTAAAPVTAGSPYAFATGDKITFGGTYETV